MSRSEQEPTISPTPSFEHVSEGEYDLQSVGAIVPANDPVYADKAAISATEDIKRELEGSRDAKLEAQFCESREFKLPHETMEYAMIDPHDGNHEAENKDWTIFIGGFASIKETYKTEMLDLARSGRRVIFLSPDKGVTPLREDEDYFNARAGALPDTIRDKAAAVALLLEHLGISEVNVIGHSQGGAVAAAFAGMREGMVRRLLLDNPVGLIGEDSVGSLLHRVKEEAKVEEVDSQPLAMWVKQIRKIVEIPLWRATKEIPGIAHTDIRPILENMMKVKSKRGDGPEVILINSNNDQIFKKEDVEAGLGEHALEQYVDRWLVYAEKERGHGKVDRGDGELFAELVNEPTRASIIHHLITEDLPIKKAA